MLTHDGYFSQTIFIDFSASCSQAESDRGIFFDKRLREQWAKISTKT
jgi:hypothetical protein